MIHRIRIVACCLSILVIDFFNHNPANSTQFARNRTVNRHFILALDVSISVNETQGAAAIDFFKNKLEAQDRVWIYFFSEKAFRWNSTIQGDVIKNTYFDLFLEDDNNPKEEIDKIRGWIGHQNITDFTSLLNQVKADLDNNLFRISTSLLDNVSLVLISDGKHTKKKALKSSLKEIKYLPVRVDNVLHNKPLSILMLEVGSTEDNDKRKEEKYLINTKTDIQAVFGNMSESMDYKEKEWNKIFDDLRYPTYIKVDFRPRIAPGDIVDSVKFSLLTNSRHPDQISLEYSFRAGAYIGEWKNIRIGPGAMSFTDGMPYVPSKMATPSREASLFIHGFNTDKRLILLGGEAFADTEYTANEPLPKSVLTFKRERNQSSFYINPKTDTIKIPIKFTNATGKSIAVSSGIDFLDKENQEEFQPVILPKELDLPYHLVTRRDLAVTLQEGGQNWFSDHVIRTRIEFLRAVDNYGLSYNVESSDRSRQTGFDLQLIVASKVRLGISKIPFLKQNFLTLLLLCLFSFVVLLTTKGIIKYRNKPENELPDLIKNLGTAGFSTIELICLVATGSLFFTCILSHATYDLFQSNGDHTVYNKWIKGLLVILAVGNGGLFIALLEKYRFLVGTIFLALFWVLLQLWSIEAFPSI